MKKNLVGEKVTMHDITRHCEEGTARRGNLLSGLLRHFVPRNDGDSSNSQSLLSDNHSFTYSLSASELRARLDGGNDAVIADVNRRPVKRERVRIHLFTRKCKAFTLAEVLITLAVIGIVAAMTIPNLVQNYKKLQTVAQLKKVYSTLSNALNLSVVDNGSRSNWSIPAYSSDLDLTDYYKKYWFPYLKAVKVCNTYSECGYGSNNPFLNLKGTVTGNTLVAKYFRIPFITSDGVLYDISVYGGSPAVPDSTVIVDLNGSNPPNKMGHDVFFLIIIYDKVRPYCFSRTTDEINSDCSVNGSGSCCLKKIMMDGWKMAEDYPW